MQSLLKETFYEAQVYSPFYVHPFHITAFTFTCAFWLEIFMYMSRGTVKKLFIHSIIMHFPLNFHFLYGVWARVYLEWLSRRIVCTFYEVHIGVVAGNSLSHILIKKWTKIKYKHTTNGFLNHEMKPYTLFVNS